MVLSVNMAGHLGLDELKHKVSGYRKRTCELTIETVDSS